MISCNWSASYSLTVPTTWTDGIYLARLSNANGYTNYIIFAVRDDSRMADLLYSQPVNTYQAYNNWPADHIHGKDLHAIDSSGPNTIGGDARAVKVSFDRPYSKNGAHLFFNWEIYFIHWMEKMGYDVTYTTNIDMHAHPNRMAAFKGVLSVGRDEYWSKPMYDGIVAARDAGVSLAFFGANPIYWQVRLESSASGVPNRVLVCYKDQTIDPVHEATTTVKWRDPFLNRPEQTLTGVMNNAWIGNNPNFSYVVQNSSHWVYSGTGFKDGDAVPGIEGY